MSFLPVKPPQTQSILTRDGIRLDADVYYPDAPGEYPILLMRQPYGRAIASTVVYAHPIWYASQGFIVVIQDVRGRGTSEGEFDLFANEINDGSDTVNWAANLPNSNGRVGMYGFSYQGMTQLYAASAQPTALKTICPSMAALNLYDDWAYENGAFCLQMNLAWAIQLEAETARLKGDAETYQKLYVAARNLPVNDLIPTLPEITKLFSPNSFYHSWLNNPTDNEYWQNLSPDASQINLPMLHIGGWFDTYLQGTIHTYQTMVKNTSYPQHLIIGPWGHIPWARQVGQIDFGNLAHTSIDQLQIAWFNYWLKDIDNGILTEPSVRLFEMGSNQWLDFNSFSADKSEKIYYLQTTGLAHLREDAGSLIANTDHVNSLPNNPNNNPNNIDVLVHDPWRPVPSLGGHNTFPAGVFQRSSLDQRPDILTYTTAVLTADLHILGNVQVKINCRVNADSFDLSAVLSEVKNSQSVYNFTQGYRRINDYEKDTDLLVTLTLQPTCIIIPAGSAIRLSLSATCFPAYPVNSGQGESHNQAKLIDQQIITIQVKCGDIHSSDNSLDNGLVNISDDQSQIILPLTMISTQANP
jgi:putative CocE/NonD family hydrolase